MTSTPRTRLLDAVQRRRADDGVLHAPGVSGAVTALAAAEAGAEVLYLSGAVTSAVQLGRPDLGYVAAGDILELAERIRRAVPHLPLVADADTGYGNAMHVHETVSRYADAGLAGLHLEDQVNPKRCGHMAGKDVIDAAEAASKIEAAVDASAGRVAIIARTDAFSVLGLDEAIARVRAFGAAGADLVFVEGVTDAADLAPAAAAVDVPLVLNRSAAGGAVTPLSDATLSAAGVGLVIHPVAALLAQVAAAQQVFAAILADGHAGTDPLSWDAFNALLGLPDHLAREQRWA